jgi:hypothetical protein
VIYELELLDVGALPLAPGPGVRVAPHLPRAVAVVAHRRCRRRRRRRRLERGRSARQAREREGPLSCGGCGGRGQGTRSGLDAARGAHAAASESMSPLLPARSFCLSLAGALSFS